MAAAVCVESSVSQTFPTLAPGNRVTNFKSYHRRSRFSSVIKGVAHNLFQPSAGKELSTAYEILTKIYDSIKELRDRHAAEISRLEQNLVQNNPHYKPVQIITENCD